MALLALAGAALADSPNVDTVVRNFEIASNGVSAKLVVLAKQTAVSAMMLQWLLSYWKDLFKPDIPDALLKAAGMITWFGATIFLIGHVDLISAMFKQYLALAGELSGMLPGDFTPWGVIVKGRNVIDATHAGIAAKLGGNWFAFGQNMLASGTLLIVDLIVIAAFLILGLSLFVVNVEFWLIFAVAPLAFGLIPLSAFRDQGIAPIKGVISVGLRVLVLGVIIAVAQSLSDTLIASINANGIPGDPNSTSVLARMLEYLAGMLGCAAMAMYAGKIASAIASGSATFTGSDAMAAGGAMAAGAAAATAATAGVGRSAMSGMSGAGSAASNALSKANSNPVVAPAGIGGGAMGGGKSGGTGHGLPLEKRPGVPLFGGGTDAPGANNAGGGNAGGHGFGQPLQNQPPSGASAPGAGNQGGANSGASNAPASIGGGADSGASNWEKFNQRSDRFADGLQQDHANVSVSVNLGADK